MPENLRGVASMMPPGLKKAAWRVLPFATSPRLCIGYIVLCSIYALKRIWVRDCVVVSPGELRHLYSLWKLLKLRGLKVVSESHYEKLGERRPLAFVRHHDCTWDSEMYERFINGRCIDISKSKVDQIFGNVFGYSTKISPSTHHGIVVVKSEINYTGDGEIISCPVGESDIKSCSIYQKLVNNLIGPGVVEEFRVSIIGGQISDVIRMTRIEENRLKGRGGGGTLSTVICSAEDVFSACEIKKILAFCQLLGLEFGELDILPDVSEKRIYIVDANKTPAYMTRGSSFRLENIRNLIRRASMLERFLMASAYEGEIGRGWEKRAE